MLSYAVQYLLSEPRSYSSIFQPYAGNSTEKMSRLRCELTKFCADNPPGRYCYRPAPDKCSQQQSQQQGMQGTKAPQSPLARMGKFGEGWEDCLPVAMVLCPEAVFLGCGEGYACHQDPEPWPWDKPEAERMAYMNIPHFNTSEFPYDLYLASMNSTNSTATRIPGAAHCYPVFRDNSTMVKLQQQQLLPALLRVNLGHHRGDRPPPQAHVLQEECEGEGRGLPQGDSPGGPQEVPSSMRGALSAKGAVQLQWECQLQRFFVV